MTDRDTKRPVRVPLHLDITEETIEKLVHNFYGKVRKDQRLGPLFDNAISEPWPDHLDKMCDFWSSVTRLTGRFKGSPMQTHARIKDIRIEDFAIWLSLWRETAHEECPPDIAAIFIQKAEMIAQSLQLGLFYRPDGIPVVSAG